MQKIFRFLFAIAIAVLVVIVIPLLIVKSGILPEYIKQERISIVTFAFLSLVITVSLVKRDHLAGVTKISSKSMIQLLAATVIITSGSIIIMEGFIILMFICYGILPEGGTDICGVLDAILCIALVELSCLYPLFKEEKTEHDKTRDKPFISRDDEPKQGRKEKKVYLTRFRQTPDGVLVQIPDWDIETKGENLAAAIRAARDAIGRKRADMEDGGNGVLEASISQDQTFYSLLDVDFTEPSKKQDNG